MKKQAKIRLGVSTAAYYGKLLTEEAAAKIAESGADCCEVFLQTEQEYTREFAGTVRRALTGLPCSSVHPMGTTFENQFFSRSRRQREDAREKYLRVLDAAAELGAQNYVYHGRNTPQLSPLPFDPQRNADVVGEMCLLAAERGITLAWENVYWCQLTTPERAREMRRLLPEVRFTLDNKQAMRAGADPFEFLSAMGDAIVNAHLCDCDGQGNLFLPGQGSFPFRRFFAELAEASPTCSAILEPYAYLIHGEEDVPEALRVLREMARADLSSPASPDSFPNQDSRQVLTPPPKSACDRRPC